MFSRTANLNQYRPGTPTVPLVHVWRTALLLAAMLLLSNWSWSATTISATRVWPAQDYTRITLESAAPLQFQLLALKNPDRLALDIDGINVNAALEELSNKIGGNDPYVKSVRVGRFKQGTVRLVFDLKADVKPEVFTLRPVAEYGHRLVLDIYPAQSTDPLITLLEKNQAAPAATAAAGATGAPTTASINKAPEALPAPDVARPPTPANPPNAASSATPKPARAERTLIVAIDAGHGGEDPGAKGRRGTYEKNVTLAIARRLKEVIDREPNMRGVLTRDGDYFIPLQGRVQKARRLNADLFVSVHADSFIRPDASEHGATSVAARWLAKKENEADLIGGVNLDVADPYLKQTLLDLSQTATINDSLKLARAVLDNLGKINTLHKGTVEQAGFAVLKSPDIPSILVETAFISNPAEEQKLTDDGYQQKLAEAIFSGIKNYFAKNPALSRARVANNP